MTKVECKKFITKVKIHFTEFGYGPWVLESKKQKNGSVILAF
ncbi:hypothetical protein LEP1GSC024_4321 [Leptospira noguchii str. 2001034031]|uniref:Uncharacterized protein n=1 Tax=Leptospira noguchii str. 2001034031 TaxID=1193053 RepID=M6YNB6_9LEPT|nr:hypothetical protein LEP1GSC024_4321 [Leptospira noguchii str. 2001034031]